MDERVIGEIAPRRFTRAVDLGGVAVNIRRQVVALVANPD